MTISKRFRNRQTVVTVTVLAVMGIALLAVLAAQHATAQRMGAGGQATQPYYTAQNTQATTPPLQTVQPQLRAYPCRPGEAAKLADWLRTEFIRVPNLRIVADPRTSQILVQAPEGMQAQIAQRLNETPKPAAATETLSPPPPSSSPLVLSREVRLQHTSAGQVETALTEMLAERLTRVTGPSSSTKNYQLALPGGERVDLTIDPPANRVVVQGIGRSVDSCVRLIQALDSAEQSADRSTRMVSLQTASPASVQQALAAIRAGNAPRPIGAQMVAVQAQQPQTPPAANGQGATAPPEQQSLIGPVQIELLEGLDVLVIRGHKRDVERALEIIDQIEQLSVETVPAVEIYHLGHVDCQALTELITPLYEQVFLPRQGTVSITALVKPNALLLIGRPESVQTVLDLVKRLDRPVAPETQFRVFRLKHAAAETAQTTVTEFFEERAILGTKVLVTADFRSNALIVQASPRDMTEVAELIDRIDTPTSEAVNELRVFQLENSLAEDVADILQRAINGQDTARRTGAGPAGTPGAAAGAGARRNLGAAQEKSIMLRFVTVDTKGQRRLSSGILVDVRITADPRANALLVSAPAESMELIEALIRQVDQLPAAEAQIKVFTIVNSDAESLMGMLETLFGEQTQRDQPAVRTGVTEGESSLVQLRLAVDMRTNSILASGSMGDLQVVEAILLKLDDDGIRNRKSEVYRLKNAPAEDVARAINDFLSSERQVQQINPDLLTPFQQIEREVVVVPEVVSNSLIVSATPRFFEEIKLLVEQLDERPPMVMIQVLIAEVLLNDADEFGVELGLQDSILFDRSMLGDLITTTQTVFDAVTGLPVSENQTIQSATNTPGFAFNNQLLGNSGSNQALAGAGILGSQSLSHFAVGRMNDELGFGGLVLSASSETVSILVRALRESRRLDVLARPQVMTLDNQPAFVQVGERVPRVISAQINETGQQITTRDEDVGLILGVTPRISPDGLVVMEIDAEKSEVGKIDEGIPVAISITGDEVRSPRIKITLAQTTVSAASGQTVVLGGLITKSISETHRRVPVLADIPLLGNLFRYDATIEKKAELLIIMTPHIVKNEDDAEEIRQVEASRMSWCLGDVIEMHGDWGLRGRNDEWSDAETNVIYPDLDPSGQASPTPNDAPDQPKMGPAPGNPPLQSPPGSPDSGATMPGGPNIKATSVGRAVYPTPSYPGRIEPAIYQGAPSPALLHQRSPGPVVRSTYDAPLQPLHSPVLRLPPTENRPPAGPQPAPSQTPPSQTLWYR